MSAVFLAAVIVAAGAGLGLILSSILALATGARRSHRMRGQDYLGAPPSPAMREPPEAPE